LPFARHFSVDEIDGTLKGRNFILEPGRFPQTSVAPAFYLDRDLYATKIGLAVLCDRPYETGED